MEVLFFATLWRKKYRCPGPANRLRCALTLARGSAMHPHQHRAAACSGRRPDTEIQAVLRHCRRRLVQPSLVASQGLQAGRAETDSLAHADPRLRASGRRQLMDAPLDFIGAAGHTGRHAIDFFQRSQPGLQYRQAAGVFAHQDHAFAIHSKSIAVRLQPQDGFLEAFGIPLLTRAWQALVNQYESLSYGPLLAPNDLVQQQPRTVRWKDGLGAILRLW